MILTDEQAEEMSKAAMPLMIWLVNNCHPHVKAIVDSEGTELLEGLAVTRRENIKTYWDLWLQNNAARS